MTKGKTFVRAAILTAALIGTLGAHQAYATTLTVATFADPSPGSDVPLFEYDATSNMLTGSWSGTGLTLETLAGSFPNATFTLSATVAVLGGAGVLEFFDSTSSSILKIDFEGSSLSVLGFGATEFLAIDIVAMSGQVIDDGFVGGTLEMESFGFAFANQLATDGLGSFSTTASFTSSAMPEPASMALVAFGAAFVLARRRKSSACP